MTPAQSLEEDALAAAAAFGMAVTKAIAGLSSLTDARGPYLARILEDGLHDLENTNYRTVAEERRAAFLDNVKAHYIDFIATVGK
jgi:hypothetical protein